MIVYLLHFYRKCFKTSFLDILTGFFKFLPLTMAVEVKDVAVVVAAGGCSIEIGFLKQHEK